MTAMVTTNGTQTAAVVKAPAEQLKDMFTAWRPTIRAVLPKHLDVDRVIKMTMSVYSRSPELQKCTLGSVIKATIMAAELGLETSPLLGECAFIAFNTKQRVRNGNKWEERPVTEAKLLPMVRGLVKLARQSGEITTIMAETVDANDDFRVTKGLEPNIHHVPDYDNQSGKFWGAYAVAKFKDGSFQFEVMTFAEIMAIKARSKSGDSGPWSTDLGEMLKKTVVKRLCKRLPQSAEKPALATAVAADNATDEGMAFRTDAIEQLEELEGDAPPPQLPPTRTEALRDVLEKDKES